MVNFSSSLTYHDHNHPDYRSGLRTKSRLWIRITDHNQIMDPDYGPNQDYGFGLRTKSRLWIQITDQIQIMDPDYGPNPDYGSGLRTKSRLWIRITDQIQIMDPEYRSWLRIGLALVMISYRRTKIDHIFTRVHWPYDGSSEFRKKCMYIEHWTKCYCPDLT